MPFGRPWSDEPPDELRRRMYAWHASCRAAWTPESWQLLLVAFADGEPVGAQDVAASSFAVRREVETASWVGAAFQGAGIGTEMRQCVLHLAFAGLDALAASSGAYEENVASNHVSVTCGYERNGVRSVVRRRGAGAPGGAVAERAMEIRYRIEGDDWLPRRRDDIRIGGLDADVRRLLGAPRATD